MASQLDEMKHDRELQNQPTPWIRNTQFVIEKPRLYYSPPEDEFSFVPRYALYICLKNIGDSPAMAINVTASVAIADDPKISSLTHYDSVARHIDILEPAEIYPPHPSRGILLSFHPHSGEDTMLLKSMRENTVKMYPHLLIRIIYKNMLGGCFLLQNEFRLYPIKEEQGETLKNWTTQIAAFPIQYKDELESMRRLIKKDYEEYKEVFNKVQTQLMEVITEGNLDLSLYPIPQAMESKVISEEAYQKCAKSLHYGTPLSPIVRYAECEEKCGSSH